MASQNVIKEYSDSINVFRRRCIDAGMSEEEFRKIYFESLQSHEIPVPDTLRRQLFKTRFKVFFFVFLIVGFLSGIYNYKTLTNCLICNIQEYIYPGLRLLRKFTIPFLSLFPTLTDLYHETCLIQNPFFSVTDMDCWPCSSVTNVREVHNPQPSNRQQNAPFIYETNQQIINIELFHKIYKKNKNAFDKESTKVLVNNKYYISVHEMFTQNLSKENNNLYVWKFNNANVAKLLREYIPRPTIVPKFGQSIERFIIIDTSQKSFKIPDTECSYSFILSLSGTRTITLVPAEECKLQCKTLKVDLKETYLLWYNWWYWRPLVQPSMSNNTFIAHVGSYC